MYKTIAIGDKEVRLTASVFALLTYKQQFHKDLIPTFIKLVKETQALQELDEEAEEQTEAAYATIENLHIEYYKMLWAYAKAADREVPSFEEWTYTYGEAEFATVFSTVKDLTMSQIKTDRKNA